MKLKKMKHILVNKSQLAKMLDRSLPAVDNWIRRGLPYVKRGDKSTHWLFNFATVVEWRERRAAELSQKSIKDDELLELKRRKLEAKTLLAEFKLREKLRSMRSIE
jgi:phage terminase Nu1 subunit (DNA packaging protein)